MNDAATPRRLDRYEILDEIAQGAMGVVYKARDPLIDRIVAIKTVALGMSDAETEAYERRFFREAKSAGRLNHPNVVTIFDVGKTEGTAYIAMEFLDGQSLREIMDSGVVLPPQRIADIAAEIAEGLAFAHDNGVVHRDVKPANVMVLASGAVKITDFGIALLPTGTRTVAGNAFGSPRYTSPEQVMGRPVDGRSDIFSLGATVYEMLTGASPFQGGDLNTILTQVLSDPTPPPSSRNPRLPRAFDHIVGKALAKDPADRYQTAQAMADDLRRFDTLELGTAGPGPLPALEHPTTPFNVRDLVPPAAESLAAAGGRTVESLPAGASAPAALPPTAVPGAATPWWRHKSVAVAALGVLLVGIAVVLGLRDGPASDAGAVAKAPVQAGAIGGTATMASATTDAGARTGSTPPVTGAAIDPADTRKLAGNASASAAMPPKPLAAATPSTDPARPPATEGKRAGSGNSMGAAGMGNGSAPVVGSAGTVASGTVASGTVASGTAAPGTAAPSTVNPGAVASDAATSGLGAPAPPAAPPQATVAAAHAPKPTGRVSFAIAPWGEIYVDGRRRGIAPPLSELRLPAGKHVVEIRNATFPPHRETIELGAGEAIRVRHKFQ